ncbi:Uncharacterised protein [Mycobacteroides abscessus subsp. abscessus]|nr:Uncharacterised protein [Mycobacteroides abscessus subsp. abscessus]
MTFGISPGTRTIWPDRSPVTNSSTTPPVFWTSLGRAMGVARWLPRISKSVNTRSDAVIPASLRASRALWNETAKSAGSKISPTVPFGSALMLLRPNEPVRITGAPGPDRLISSVPRALNR